MPGVAGDGSRGLYHFFGLYMEYLGPSMTPPASHVILKNEIFGPKNGVDSKYGYNTSTGCDRSHVTLIKTKIASLSFVLTR